LTAPRHNLRASAASAFVAADPASEKLLREVQQVAASSSNVLITGESGTGKDLIASLIHYLGAHPEAPLVKIDCASLPHELMESELFGYERGAFTGANQTKRGRLELAEEGTLVFDEIASLSPAMQSKLLRVLEERDFVRLGGTRAIRLEARVVVLSNVDLEAAVKEGAFREDLYHRVNVLSIAIKPLRQRRADIAPIAQHILKQLAEAQQRQLRIEDSALELLARHDFPGNVRELRNMLERATLRARSGRITSVDLPENLRSPQVKVEARLSLVDVEKRHIAEVLDHTRGKKGRAAEILGISRKNLLEKRKKYEL